MFSVRQLSCVMIATQLLYLSGCGSKLPTVEGTVTLDGAPLADARIVFEAPDRATAFAKTDDDGKYDVMTASQRGLEAGIYKIAVSAYKTRSGGSESPIPVLKTPKKYNSSQTSGLEADVKTGRNTDVNLQLQSSEK